MNIQTDIREYEYEYEYSSHTASDPETPDIYSCNHCEVNFKTEKGLKIHIGKVHKEDVL